MAATTAVAAMVASPSLAAPIDRTPPTAPATLTSSEVTDTSVLLTWSKATDNVGVVGYDIYETPPSGTAFRVDNTTTSLVVRISNLLSGKTYKFYVQARDKAKNVSPSSPIVTITTTIPVPPPPPPDWADCSGGYVALSYDDGPNSTTPNLVNELKKYNVRATWFDVGLNVQQLPAYAMLQATQGNVQNHSWDHSSMSGASTGTAPLSASQITQQLQQTSTAILSATGTAPTQFRPPYGDTSATLSQVESSLGLLEVGWTTDTEDWQNPPATTIAATALTAPSGGIVLMHDGRANTIAAVKTIVSGLVASHRCPGRVAYSATPQQAWEGWTFNAAAAAW